MGSQTLIPGTNQEMIPEIEKAAEAYREIRDQRMKLTTKEVEAQAVLVAAMEKHQLKAYRCVTSNPLVVTIVNKTKAKVRTPNEEEVEADVEAEVGEE